MKVVALIPARFKSERLPGKPLLKINNKTVIEMVYERVSSAKSVDKVIVATDDKRIYDCVLSFGGNVEMTKQHKSGTDRIAEVAKRLSEEYKIVLNVQGDEPLIEPDDLDAVIKPFFEIKGLKMSTLVTEIKDRDDIFNPNVVKVVRDNLNFAIYFSRNPIPFFKTKEMSRDFDISVDLMKNYLKHIGLYCFLREFLIQYTNMNTGVLERLEGLEQLRVIENGYKIYTVKRDSFGIGVDTMEDFEKLKNILGEKK
jgi:3-deoxy-manno-octulosonate cytidylyltransferase (CMP-KDO synthetase)